MMKTKPKAAPDHHAAFRAMYHDRECARVARGDLSPEALGKLEAREQIKRDREQLGQMMRSWSQTT